MNLAWAPSRIAVIGAGIAGATCAQALAAAGHAVHVFDKSRGPGGRMATRRAEWLGPQGEQRLSSFDHGAPGFVAGDPAFRPLVAEARAAGVLADWSPRLAPGSRPLDDVGQRHVPVPDMPALCRWLLAEASQHWSFAVQRLHRSPLGWHLEAAGLPAAGPFDQVLLAIPPAQAAPLLAEFRPDWAEEAALAVMQPCWTLMGVTDAPPLELGWDMAQPQAGLLATVLRADARPGRSPSAGEASWVLHAHSAWSCEHLEQDAEWVQVRMQAALEECLQAGFKASSEATRETSFETTSVAACEAASQAAAHAALHWRHAVVHRWRYAQAQASAAAPSRPCWWDAAHSLGVCGDFLGSGVGGVEGAWLSAQALVECMKPRGHAAP
jgi:predicted NAD/FAD-dependent oxidoreductase